MKNLFGFLKNIPEKDVTIDWKTLNSENPFDFDYVDLNPCVGFKGDGYAKTLEEAEGMEPCEENDSNLLCWSVYLHHKRELCEERGLRMCVADFKTKEEAQAFEEFLFTHYLKSDLEVYGDIVEWFTSVGYMPDDSRQRLSNYQDWAKEFMKLHENETFPHNFYMEWTEEFCQKKEIELRKNNEPFLLQNIK